ncbi:MAG: DUF2948 family protein [Hyphomicrobiaceae bacterium]|nr:DUF2948 family protein [Hyphomicrobiaceae bacterium]
MALLKLLALDEQDLEVISAHMQDAILRVKDMAWQPGSHRFVAVFNRFDWPTAHGLDADEAVAKAGKKPYERCRCALRFDHVETVSLKRIRFDRPDTVLELLAIRFEAGEAPSGTVELIFADNYSIRLRVECIEAELNDLSPCWGARSQPEHEGQS